MQVPHLVVDGLRKDFTLHLLGGRRVPAFAELSFTVPRGAFVAVIGRSGSGKSSLVRCLYRSYLATSGAAWLMTSSNERVDLVSADDDTIIRLRRDGELRYVSQFLRVIPRVPAVDLVAEPLMDRGCGRDEARSRARGLLARLNLPSDLHDAFPALFSGGEQQRVNLARALVVRPRLLLLDEPTSALDAASQGRVISLLREARAAGTTMVGVFHDLRLVRELAHQVIALEDGSMLFQGGPEIIDTVNASFSDDAFTSASAHV